MVVKITNYNFFAVILHAVSKYDRYYCSAIWRYLEEICSDSILFIEARFVRFTASVRYRDIARD